MQKERQTLECILKQNSVAPEDTSIHKEGFRVYKDLQFGGKSINLICFDNGKHAIQEARKTHFLPLNEYLLTLSSHHDEPDVIDLKYTHLYNLKDGKEVSVNLSGKFFSGCMVIIDKKLISISTADSCPQFMAVINSTLQLIPCLQAEQIIRNFVLNEKQLKSLIKMYREKHFELHNGVVINPETLSVPTILEIASWKKRTRAKSVIIDSRISPYSTVLQRKEAKETPGVKFIRSTDF
ncbi:MAG: hypothetical protein IKW58_02235 [Alphaproteobacteria bacterium]|nr:hypothetical protein [Alphaproteobacteria bacterium]